MYVEFDFSFNMLVMEAILYGTMSCISLRF